MPQHHKVTTVTLSFGEVEVEVLPGLDEIEVTEATEDYLRWVIARLGVPSLEMIDPRLLALIANSRNVFQAAVKDVSPRSHASRNRGK